MIRGRSVGLRPVEEQDLPLIHRWMNDAEIWRYMDYERPFSLEDVREDLERSRAEGVPMTVLVGDRPIGRIGLNGLRRRDRVASLYLYIGEPEFWGHGYARDAVTTLLAYAFDRFDLHLVELWTLGDNDRAVAAYQACGFRPEARLRDRSFKEGGYVERVVMSVTREEFAAAQAPQERPAG